MDPIAQRLLDTLDLWEDGIQLLRERLRRTRPDASDDEIEAEIGRWLDRPEELPPGFMRGHWPRR